jgi:hypothetical protein
VIVIDDTLLLGVLAGAAPAPALEAAAASEVATTGSWYWRLTRAVLDEGSSGSLSHAFGRLAEEDQRRVRDGLRSLPLEVGLLSLRHLVPIMAALDSGRRLNLLTAEAIAAALVLEADIAVTTRSALLEAACERIGIDVVLIS